MTTRRRGADSEEVIDARRRWLSVSGLFLPLLVMPAACGSPAARGATSLPLRVRGGQRVDVRAAGATGNGVTDDTAAIQRAIDDLPESGGTVHVPAGIYAIDATRSVRLRSRMHFELAPDAQLVALPNAAERAYVVLIQDASDVEVSGGRIRGDRDRHLGSTGEWGHGLTVRGASRVTIRDLHVSGCWGDGISIGSNPSRPGRRVAPSEDVVVSRVVCSDNWRQGLTIGRSRRVLVQDSEFSGTRGTPPAAGIDIEPDSGDAPDGTGARDITIARCFVHDNHGPGIQIFKRSRGVRIEDCTIRGNGNSGVLAVGVFDVEIASNRLQRNGHRDMDVRGKSQGVMIRNNRFDPDQPWRRQVRVNDDSSAVTLANDNRND
jgi:polygalacturonase